MDRADPVPQSKVFLTSPEAIKHQSRAAIIRSVSAVLLGIGMITPIMIARGTETGAVLFGLGFTVVVMVIIVLRMSGRVKNQALTALELDEHSATWLSGTQVRNRIWKSEIAGITENERQIEIELKERPDGIWIPRKMFSTSDYIAIRNHVGQWDAITEGTRNRRKRDGILSNLVIVACFAVVYFAQNPWLVGVAGAIAITFLGRSYLLLRQMKARIPFARAAGIVAMLIFFMLTLMKVLLLTVGMENFWDFLPVTT